MSLPLLNCIVSSNRIVSSNCEIGILLLSKCYFISCQVDEKGIMYGFSETGLIYPAAYCHVQTVTCFVGVVPVR